MCCSKETFVTSAIALGIIYLVTVTAVATNDDGANAFNILALISGLGVGFMHALAVCDLIIVKSEEKPLGEWPRWMHILALVPASLFMLFWPAGAGTHAGYRFLAALLGGAMFWEHTSAFMGAGLYGREAQANYKGIFSPNFPC